MNHAADCIFCRIVQGAIPSVTLYSDDRVLAFLDIGPLSEGHTLIIPKNHYVTLDEMTAEDAAACMAIAPRLAKAIMKATGATAYNLLQNNGRAAHQLVMHVHFHIIPKTDTGGLGVHWPAGQIDKSRAAEIQRMITAAM